MLCGAVVAFSFSNLADMHSNSALPVDGNPIIPCKQSDLKAEINTHPVKSKITIVRNGMKLNKNNNYNCRYSKVQLKSHSQK